MPRLNDTHMILLSTASRRDDLAFYPVEGIATDARTSRAVDGLIKAGLAQRRGEDAVFATVAGLAAIGIETTPDGLASEQATVKALLTSKTAAVLELLYRDAGATMPELIALTNWLPHTTRAALTGLRKKGHTIERTKRDDQTCYRIAVTQ